MCDKEEEERIRMEYLYPGPIMPGPSPSLRTADIEKEYGLLIPAHLTTQNPVSNISRPGRRTNISSALQCF